MAREAETAGREPSAGGTVSPVQMQSAASGHEAVEASESPSVLFGAFSGPSSGATAKASSGPGAPGGPAALLAITRSVGDVSCELSALQGRGCAPGLIPGQALLTGAPASPDPAARVAALTGEADAGNADTGHGVSTVVRLPVSPAPGPAPSGVSGGTATGSSGLAFSGFV